MPAFSADTKPFLVGNYRDSLTGFEHVGDVIIAPDLTIYAVDRTAAAIRRFDKTGKPLADLQLTGAQLLRPVALAMHGQTLLVLDQGDHRVRAFAPDGKLVAAWGGRGSGKDNLLRPSAIASDGKFVYVADTGNHRVIVAELSGKDKQILGAGFGNDGAHLIGPAAVAVVPGEQGRIYVADTGNNRLVVFKRDGSLDRTWGTWGAFDDMLDQPTDLRFRNGHLYVTDRRNHRIHTLTPDLERIDTWGIHEIFPHEGGGRLHYPQHFDVAPDASFAVVAEPVEDRIQRFISRDAAPPPEQDFIYVGGNSKRNRTHFADHLSTDGQLLVMIEPENHFLVMFDLRLDVPVVISKFSERGQNYGLMMDAHSPVLDARSGKLFVADAIKRRIQEFRFDYDPKSQLGYKSDLVSFARAFDFKRLAQAIPQKLSWAFEPQHMTLGPDRLIYMLDQRNQMVFVFDQEMAFKRSIQLALPAPAPSDLQSITVDAKGQLFVADCDAALVYRFDSKGQLLTSFGGNDQLKAPVGVALDAVGKLYVTDRDQHRVVVFDGQGKQVETFGSHGDWMGELWKPMGVTLDAQGRVILVDQGNHRGQIFDTSGKWLVTFGMGRAYTYKSPPPRPEKPPGALTP